MKKTILLLLLVFFTSLTALFLSKPAEAPLTARLSPPLPEKNIIITAVGDIMMHNTQITAGYRPETGTYDFSSFFRHVKPLLQKSHFVIGNLETTLSSKPAEYGGYPRFCSPAVLAQNLKETGFHLLTTANNHCLDKGITGLQNTLQHLDEANLLHTGTARSKEEKDALFITEIEGIKTALLSYTYGTNGLFPPANHSFAVNYLDQAEIIDRIKKAREAGAQLIILCLHFGEEYQNNPNKAQAGLAQIFLEAGADIILGTHPHVLQRAEVCYLPKKEPQTTTPMPASGTCDAGNKKFVGYSLGNFISAQNGLERRTGIILNLHLGVDSLTGKPYFKKAEYIPIWTHRYTKNKRTFFEVFPIEQILTDIQAGNTTDVTPAEIKELKQAWEHALSCLGTNEDQLALATLIPIIPENDLPED